MKIPKKIWLNGSFIDGEEAKIPILSHSLHYGSGVFEGIRFYNTSKGPAIFRLEDHINRLLFSAGVVGMECSYKKQEIKNTIKELIKINGLEEGYIRPILYYGSKMGIKPVDLDTNAAIIVTSWPKYLSETAVKVKISSFIRPHPKSIVPQAKICGVYANSVLASLEAKNAGFDEALLLDFEGNIAEGPGENIFFILGKKLITPKIDNILPGITRRTVMDFAEDLGFKIEERNIIPRDILQFDEAFFTGTAAEITPVEQIDKRYFSTEKSPQIKEYYANIVRGKIQKYNHFLTYIND